jgi:hypothetical protein
MRVTVSFQRRLYFGEKYEKRNAGRREREKKGGGTTPHLEQLLVGST